ncbi:hypothetical protein ABZ178_28625 [Streptomyces massasporeus]|uniref:hypothetical protein n=1 Tax=Streptomyces massasporeus TaxID=67324 RepID=UPI0033BDC001
MSGIGPVEPANEPVNSTDEERSCDVVGTDASRPGDRLASRWSGLPAGRRRAVVAAAVIAVAAASTLALPQALAPDPHPPPYDPVPAPTPWPATVTAWHYLGPAGSLNSSGKTGRFRFAVTVEHGPAVTLRVAGTSYPGLTARAVPGPAFTVPAGTPRGITVEITVSDCSALPPEVDHPFLDVTLRNARAIQRHSFIFGRAYARDLSDLFRAACGPRTARSQPWPTGSAGSQNADLGENPPNPPRGAPAETRHPRRHNKKVTSEPAPLTLPLPRA